MPFSSRTLDAFPPVKTGLLTAVTPRHPRLPVLGVDIDVLDRPSLGAALDGFLASDRPRQIITANALMILASERAPALREAFRAADLVLPDSAGVALAARLQNRPLPDRVAGIDLLLVLCERAAARGHRVYLLGAGAGVASATGDELRRRFPGLRVVGARDGFFTPAEEPAVLEEVRRADPDLLFVALAVPRQDAWIHQNLPRLGAKVVMGVGGSFDVVAGRLRRAPRWMQGAGLEWLFRLLRQPWRLWRMRALPIFFIRILRAHFHPFSRLDARSRTP